MFSPEGNTVPLLAYATLAVLSIITSVMVSSDDGESQTLPKIFLWTTAALWCFFGAWLYSTNTGPESKMLCGAIVFVCLVLLICVPAYTDAPPPTALLADAGRVREKMSNLKAGAMAFRKAAPATPAPAPAQQDLPSATSSVPGRDLDLKSSTREILLDCGACKAVQAMKKDKIPRFSPLLRLIGFIIALPSAIGVSMAFLAWLGMIGSGDPGARAFGAVISIFVAGLSLVGGVLGWFLLMKKNVYRCTRCGYIIDRA